MENLLGHHDTFSLKHGNNTRHFSDIEVTHPLYADLKRKGEPMTDRYELTGIEHKQEVYPDNGAMTLRTVDVQVTVGFLPEHVVTE